MKKTKRSLKLKIKSSKKLNLESFTVKFSQTEYSIHY